MVTNDHPINSLSVKFNNSESYATLKPKETLSAFIHSKEVYIQSTANVDYRIWGFG